MRTSIIHDAGKARLAGHDKRLALTSAQRVEPPPPTRTSRRWHRWLRIEAIPDIHAVYGFFERLTVNGMPVKVLSWPSTRFHIFWPRPLKKIVPAFNHVAMLFGLLHAKRGQPILVREFDNLWFLLVAPVFWLVRHRVVLNVNQNVTCPVGEGTGAFALKILSRLGFRFLWLDGAAALPDIRAHFPRLAVSTPLFPVPRHPVRQRGGEGQTPFIVGLVGYFRPDKGGVEKAVALAHKLATIPGVRVAAGFWNEAQRREFCAAAADDIDTCCTYETDDYHAFLDRCHAIVILAERDAYYYRHSGILMDCIGHGTLPICPAYPLLESIVMRPVPVGAVYGESENLRCVVWRVLAQYERLRANFAVHAAARTAEGVAAALEDLDGSRHPQASAAVAAE